MKKTYFILLFLFFFPLVVYSIDFNDYFTNGTLYIDLIHSGNYQKESFSIENFRKTDFWAGPKKNLIDDMNLGKYKVNVIDKKTEILIFSTTYSSLFSEWQTVEESKRLTKGFEETVKIPFPKKPVKIEIYSRDKQNKFNKTFSFSFEPEKEIINKDKVSNYFIYKFGKIKNSSNALDILIIGEGYTKKEKFENDFLRFSKKLFKYSPYKNNSDKINLRGLFVPSYDTGADEPQKGLYKNTILDTFFYTFKLPRYLNTFSIHKLHFLSSVVPYDIIIIMVNTKRYGGAGIYNFYSTFPSDNKFSEYVFIHELGHNLGGLADEYYSSKVTYSDFYHKGVEPWEPNITALIGGKLKWEKFVSKDIPIPTPNISEYKDKIGAFEGAGYVAKGFFRPSNNCIMYNRDAKRFCPVCTDAIEKRISFYSDKKYR